MFKTCVLITTGVFSMIMLLVVMVMAAYLAARLSYVQVGNVTCFTVSHSTQQYLYAEAVTAAVFSGVSFLCALVMMGVGLAAVDKPQSGAEAPMMRD